jgi:hypothetical protein
VMCLGNVPRHQNVTKISCYAVVWNIFPLALYLVAVVIINVVTSCKFKTQQVAL